MDSYRFFEGGAPPGAYTIDGSVISFNTDFRAWLRYEHILRQDLPEDVRASACAALAIRSAPPGVSLHALMQAMAWFHSCGDSERIALVNPSPRVMRRIDERPHLVSLYWDFWQLWASFRQQYGIDLYECGEIHWWEFKRLLHGLTNETPWGALRWMRGVKDSADLHHPEKKAAGKEKAEWADFLADQKYMALPKA